MWYSFNGFWERRSQGTSDVISMLKAKKCFFWCFFSIIIFIFCCKMGWESSNTCFQFRAWQKHQRLFSSKHSLALLICSHPISKAVLHLAKAGLGELWGKKALLWKSELVTNCTPGSWHIAPEQSWEHGWGIKHKSQLVLERPLFLKGIGYSLWTELYSSLGFCVLSIIGAVELDIYIFFYCKTV